MIVSAVQDKRERYYEDRVRSNKRRYRECHSPSVELLLNLFYTYDIIQSQCSHRFAQYGLTMAGFNVLMILRQYGKDGCPLHEIGELLLVSRANITGVVDSLETHGWVERVPDSRDRRVRLGVITKEGDALLESVLPDHYQFIRKSFSGLTDAEKADLSRLLRKLRESAQQPTS